MRGIPLPSALFFHATPSFKGTLKWVVSIVLHHTLVMPTTWKPTNSSHACVTVLKQNLTTNTNILRCEHFRQSVTTTETVSAQGLGFWAIGSGVTVSVVAVKVKTFGSRVSTHTGSLMPLMVFVLLHWNFTRRQSFQKNRGLLQLAFEKEISVTKQRLWVLWSTSNEIIVKYHKKRNGRCHA